MLRNMKRRTVAYLISGAAVLAVIGFGLTTALASSPSGPEGSVPAPAPGSAVAQLSAAAKASFGVFAQPQGSPEDLRFVDEVSSGDRSLALDPNSVRLAQSSDGIEVRVAGDSESVCLVGRIPGQAVWGACGRESAAATPATPVIATTGYPAGTVSQPGGQHAVTALFPDGATNVALTSPSGSVTSVGIVNNTIAVIAADDDTLSWTGPEGKTYSSPLPH